MTRPGPLLWAEGAVVAAAAIGVDRVFGFGLKYGGREFNDTHLQQV